MAVADAFDAMTSDRPYRLGISTGEALEELRKCSGTQFDPDAVNAFLYISEPDRENAALAGVERIETGRLS